MSDISLNRGRLLGNPKTPRAIFKCPMQTKNVPNGAAGGQLTPSFTMDCADGFFMPFCVLKVPNFTNAVTITVKITDPDGLEIYNSGAKARNATYPLYPQSTNMAPGLPLCGEVTVTLTCSADPGAGGGNVNFTPYIT
jgi:hypothetical protein